MKAPRVHVHIDAIRLRGFTAAEGRGIVDGLRTELTRLLSEAAQGGGFTTSRSVGVVNGGQLRGQPNAAAASVGRTAAQRIARSIRP